LGKAAGRRQRAQAAGQATFTVTVNDKGAAEGQVAEGNADVLRQFDLKDHVRTGPDEVSRQSA
jgi:hypothetical protein